MTSFYRYLGARTWLAALALAPIPIRAGDLADAVTVHYVEQAVHRYEDSLDSARRLFESTVAFLRKPDEAGHQATKEAWLESHRIYSETEVFRFGNPNVDAWEGRVNAWPLDEGFIDYVTDDYVAHIGNPHARQNIIGAMRIPIRDEIIAEFQSGTDPKEAPSFQFTDIETNVAIGYHAIEFLLWGQDLNESNAVGGLRPFTDFVRGEACTHGSCRRRADYLSAACRLLIQDLIYIVWDWSEGRYREEFIRLPVEERLRRMLVGMGTMGYAELAGERMRVALVAADQEEEQNCFSDTTHWAILHNAIGIETLYRGEHTRADGREIQGPSLSDLVKALDPAIDTTLLGQFAATRKAARSLVDYAESGTPFDRMILPDAAEGRELVNALIAALRAQTVTLETLLERTSELAAL